MDEVADLTDSDDVVVVGFLGDDHNVELKPSRTLRTLFSETPLARRPRSRFKL